jgi:hypothetical protein
LKKTGRVPDKPPRGTKAKAKTQQKRISRPRGRRNVTEAEPPAKTQRLDRKLDNDTHREEIETFEFSFRRTEGTDLSQGKDDNPVHELLSLGRSFTTRLEILWKYLLAVGAAAEITSAENATSLMFLLDQLIQRQLAAKDGDKVLMTFQVTTEAKYRSGKEASQTLKVEVFEKNHADRVSELIKSHNAALNVLHESAIQQMFNAHEGLMGGVVEWGYRMDPSAVPKDLEIPYKSILAFSTLDELKRHVINESIGLFLRGTTDDQLKTLKEMFKVEVASVFPDLPLFKEFLLRRNLIVHAEGRANADYVRKCTQLLTDKSEIPAVGSTVTLSRNYIERAWGLTFVLGIILLHQVGRKFSQANKVPKGETDCDAFLVNATYLCIKNKHYRTAQKLLEYATKLHYKADIHKLMVTINLAQTYLWQGDETKCIEILDEQDWSATSSLFRLAVAILKGSRTAIRRELRIAATEGDIDIHDLYDWPIFQRFRTTSDFAPCVKEAFGVSHLPERKDIDIKILNTGLEDLARRLKKRTRLLVSGGHSA